MTKKRRICLISPAHLSHNPRLVKEADALAEAGYEVEVVACQFLEWAAALDADLVAPRRWHARFVRYGRKNKRMFWWSRLRQHACWPLFYGLGKRRHCAPLLGIAARAVARVSPEMEKAARAVKADFYRGHILGALPATVRAARSRGVPAGFDAEDFHAGMADPSRLDMVAAALLEQHYLPMCAMITVPSPQVAEAYVARYGIRQPISLYNVFPLSSRPPFFRPTKTGDPLRLYWFSRTIGAQRGLEDVVRAIGRLSEIDIELHLQGSWQPGYRDTLFELAGQCGVAHHRIVTHDFCPADEMVRCASHYDVGLALEPGRDENNRLTVSNKLFTFLLAGNALIATDTPGQRPVAVQLGEAAFVYQPGDVAALAGQLRRWREQRQELDLARRQAWEWGSRRYNWDTEKKRFLDAIESALNEAPQKG